MYLYTYDKAPNPQRVLLNLKYKGIELETTQVDLMTKGQFNPEFQAINPSCTVPALELDDGTVLTETVSICFYLEQCYPEKPLFGTNSLEQAQIIGWCHRLFFEGAMSIAEVLRNVNPAFADRALPGTVSIPQIEALIERGYTRLSVFWQKMDEELAGKEYLVGNQLSQADIDLFAICNFAGWVKQQIPQECQSLQSWYNNTAKLLA